MRHVNSSRFLFDVLRPLGTIFEIKPNKNSYIKIDAKTNQTSKKNVYTGGDIVTVSATLIQAIGAARIAANAIHKHFK